MAVVEVERFAKGLTVVTFVLLCWVVHRTVEVRSDCVNSRFVSFVLAAGQKVYNCKFESRLDLKPIFSPLSYELKQTLRALESVEELATVFPAASPKLTVEIVDGSPRFFEIGRRYLRLGRYWLEERGQVRRALIMAVLNSENPQAFPNEFELEVAADFLTLALHPGERWSQILMREVRFPTTAPTFEFYCKGPLRSLAHERACGPEGAEDLHTRVWGYRPLLAAALWRVFEKADLKEKVTALRRLRAGQPMPLVFAPYDGSGATLAVWFAETLKSHLRALGMDGNPMALKRTLKELQVEAPTRWELTVDITQTPAWREILEQLRKRSGFRPKERMLVFTPEGALALPANLPVTWAGADVSSQKHVMIACDWPGADEAVHVNARHMFAQHSCDKLTRSFWD